MKIMFNMPSQYGGKPTGVARVAFSLLERLLANTSHEYYLRSPWSRDQLPLALQHSRLNVIFTRRPRVMVLDVIYQTFFVSRLCKKLAIDVLFNADEFGSFYGAKKRISLIHDLYFKTIPEQIGWRASLTTGLCFKLTVMGSNYLVTVSDATRRDLERYYPLASGKTKTIHSDSTLSNTDANVTASLEADGPYILAVGNATVNKNFRLLAEAFSVLAPEFPAIKIVHVGRDENEVIKEFLSSSGLEQKLVRLTGVSDGQLASLYKQASCLCVTSTYEGFCLPILEAQGLGCPVVCSDRSAMPEIAGRGAILFDPGSVDDLVGALRSVLSDPLKVQSLREAGLKNRASFSWDKAARQYNELFES